MLIAQYSTLQYSLTVFHRTCGIRNCVSGGLEKGGPDVILKKNTQINIIEFNKCSNVLSLLEICY